MLDCLWSLVKYVGGYHGLLSGVTVRPGSVEPHSVVECLYACREGLDFGDLETLGSGMKVKPQRTQDGLTMERGCVMSHWHEHLSQTFKIKPCCIALSSTSCFIHSLSHLQNQVTF